MTDKVLRALLRARRFDELLVAHGAELSGAYHVSIGGEAVAAALAEVRTDADTIMLHHRNHGPLAALGADAESLYRELLGRDGGLQRGRSGSFHLADPERGVPYTSAMLGGGAALAAGLALAGKRRGRPAVAFALFGDGAMGEGVMYEVLNLSVAWELPVVLVCDNNTPAGREGRFAALARAHGVTAAVLDGREPRAVVDGLLEATASARGRGRPHFVEVGTEPWPGNAGFLPQPRPWLDLHRLDAVADDAFARADPVRRELRERLEEGTPLDRLAAIDAAIRAELEHAMERALDAPRAPAAVVEEGVWGP